MNENENKVLVHIDNYTGHEPIQIIYREDLPAKHLDPIPVKLPESITIIGTIGAPFEWLSKHVIQPANSVIKVKREENAISLITNLTNSHDSYSSEVVDDGISTDMLSCNLIPRSAISGVISYTKEFHNLHINDDEYYWNPQRLAKFLRLNRHLFVDPEEGMAVVSILKNIKAKITGAYEKAKDNANGVLSRTDFFQQSFEHNLPPKFSIMINILKGSPKEIFDIEIDADLVDGDIAVQLVSPSINGTVEAMRDELINAELTRISALSPDIAIIEV